MIHTHTKIYILFLAVFSLIISCKEKTVVDQWPEYLGGPDRNHYSSLDEINLTNVSQLKIAWQYHTKDSGQVQCNPIIIDGVLYGMTATVQPFALDAATGKEIWRKQNTKGITWYGTSRGVAYWQDQDDKRILYTNESWLYALNAKTGEPIKTFGDSGRVSLKTGLGPTAKDKFVISNTPGTVFEDLIIMPLRVSEEGDAALGNIQAFNIRTGKIAWVFKTIPEPNEVGYDTWPTNVYKNTDVGGANNWAGMAIDRTRGIVYVPTGSAAFDFYGGNRKGSNLFANSLLALDAKTGQRIWHFQFVHHDVLDRDPPAPPNLLTVTHNGRKIDAVAQITKQGYVFLFNRENGEALFPIEEHSVPISNIPGEESWPTQPVPLKPAPFARQILNTETLNPYAENKKVLKKNLESSRSEGPFTPLSKEGSIIFPGLDGGAEWGGAAVDPDGVLYVNSNEMAWLISLNETKSETENITNHGEKLYIENCAVCHGRERKGNPSSGFPSLVNINNRLQKNYVTNVIATGKGRMPAFKKFDENQRKLIVAFLYGEKIKDESVAATNINDTAVEFKISGYNKFLDQDGYPAISPPWGTLNAIDMNSGAYRWKKVFGEIPELTKKGIPQTGAESYGGPVVTAGGLLFIAGTKDGMFRAYNKKNGDLIWQTKLPAAAFATPSTYAVNGKQYIVIACGGTKLGALKGDSYVAFSLP